MSLGTDDIKGWWGPRKNTRKSREVLWEPCEREPTLQAATNQHRHTEGTSVERLTSSNTYCDLIPIRGGKVWVLNWQNRQPKQWSTKINTASKQQIWQPKQWSIQSSVSQISAEKPTANMVIKAHTQARGKASPCDHPSDQSGRMLDALTLH